MLSVLLHGVALVIPLRGASNGAASATKPLQVVLVNEAPVLPVKLRDETMWVSALDNPVSTPAEMPEVTAQSSTSAGVLFSEPVSPTLAQKIYRNSAELHQRPIPLMRVELSELARQYPGAKAGLTVLINETGEVDDVRIRAASDPALAQAYQAKLRDLRFVPGKISGQAVASELIIQIDLPHRVLRADAEVN